MQQYEIRILKADGSTANIFAAVQLNDNAAIRSAKKIADGRMFEVWRGNDLPLWLLLRFRQLSPRQNGCLIGGPPWALVQGGSDGFALAE